MMQESARLRILNLGITSSLDSQAIYHAVAACMDESSPDTIILCIPSDPYFCIGYHQSVRHVLNHEARSSLGYPIVRRQLGGGVTYLDKQQLFYQCIFHKRRCPATPAQNYKLRLRQPINMLNRIGVCAELRYVNEIEVSGRRIAGIGGGMIGQANVVVGNVLNDFDDDVMSSIIKSPCGTFKAMARSAMSERITTFRKEHCSDQWPDLSKILIEEYQRDFGDSVYFGELKDIEREAATRLVKRMISEEFLNEYQKDMPPCPLIRLKISGSTAIELIKIHPNERDESGFRVVQFKDDVIEDVQIADDVDEKWNERDRLRGIRSLPSKDLVIGTRLSLS